MEDTQEADFASEVLGIGGLCRPPNYAERAWSVALLTHCCRALCEHLLRSIRHSLPTAPRGKRAGGHSAGNGFVWLARSGVPGGAPTPPCGVRRRPRPGFVASPETKPHQRRSPRHSVIIGPLKMGSFTSAMRVMAKTAVRLVGWGSPSLRSAIWLSRSFAEQVILS